MRKSEKRNAAALRTSLRFEHGGGNGLFGRLARPHHELQCRIIALTGFHGEPKQRLALLGSGGRAAAEQQAVAVEDNPIVRPDVEMPRPELFVDEREKMTHDRPLFRGNAQVECTGDVEPGEIVAPVQRELVVPPLTRYADVQLIFMASLEKPVANGSDLFEKIERIAVEFLGLGDRA